MEKQLPRNEVFWMKSYPETPKLPPLAENINADVVVIGGGFGGLFCALRLLEKNKSVILLEKDRCGSGASGRSGGFLVPDPEIYPDDLIKKYGESGASDIWHFGLFGVDLVSETAQSLALNCDLRKCSSLYLANNNKGSLRMVRKEVEAIKILEGESFQGEFLNQTQLKGYLGSKSYPGGAKFNKTFSLNPYAYCQELRNKLQVKPNFKVFEGTKVSEVDKNVVYTESGKVTADKIAFCADRFVPEEINLQRHLSYVKTFILMSEPLGEKQRKIFPKENVTMAWDTDRVYKYFCLTEDGRFLLGGNDIWNAYVDNGRQPESVFYKLNRYFDNKFPGIYPKWEYFWGGRMAVVDDFLGLFGQTKDGFYVNAAATGLSMAASGGFHLAELILQKNRNQGQLIPQYFSPERKLNSNGRIGGALGQQNTVALSHLWKQL